MQINVTINGTDHSDDVEPRRLLVDFIRGTGNTGTHIGCDTTCCGACTVLVDGEEVELAPANVVVALVSYGVSPADPQTPEPMIFGSGPVQVFTQGREVQGTWTRSEEDGRWDLRSVTDEVVPLSPGATWVLLVSDGSRFSSGTISTFSQVEGMSMLAEARAGFAETTAS